MKDTYLLTYILGYSVLIMTEEKEVPENQLLNLKNQPQFNYPLVHYSNLPEYMTNFVMDVVGSACECHLRDNEKSARIIKESLDQKYGPPWYVCIHLFSRKKGSLNNFFFFGFLGM